MSPLSRRYLHSAAVFLGVGIALGLVLLVRRELLGRWPEPYLVSAHAHLILVGAVLETILGTALWMFPRPVPGTRPGGTGRATLAWWVLTAGTALRAVAESLRAVSTLGVVRWAVVAGGTAQAAGLVVALAALRSRVRPGTRTG